MSRARVPCSTVAMNKRKIMHTREHFIKAITRVDYFDSKRLLHKVWTVIDWAEEEPFSHE